MAYRKMRYNFDEVSKQFRVSFVCEKCGKRGTKTKTITHTVNPFNKREDGKVRTYEEVDVQVRVAGSKWKQEVPKIHDRCMDE